MRDGGALNLFGRRVCCVTDVPQNYTCGDRAGDWDLLAAAQRDPLDQWFDDRERYLSQRLRYNVQYYDEYVWGAEDLDAYGDWEYTTEYGWIWKPHGSSINTYVDWAPYRYGHWTWMDPYGWTWVGYEPWGWAPYHYGRWVYHKGRWAWCPRSQNQAPRSIWRPALVAFVQLDFSNNDICWYPLSYHQRDPNSRNYRHDDRHYPPGGQGRGGPPRRGGDQYPGAVLLEFREEILATDIARQRPVDERTGRRVIGADPQRGDWPRREDMPEAAAVVAIIRISRWRRGPGGQPMRSTYRSGASNPRRCA